MRVSPLGWLNIAICAVAFVVAYSLISGIPSGSRCQIVVTGESIRVLDCDISVDLVNLITESRPSHW